VIAVVEARAVAQSWHALYCEHEAACTICQSRHPCPDGAYLLHEADAAGWRWRIAAEDARCAARLVA
jgi:positive regulator of sigma E activity